MATTTDTDAVPHQRADAARNRRRLLIAAEEMFRERGLDVSVGEIAERAQIGRATLFRNFPTKHDLVVAVVVERMRETVADCKLRLTRAGDEELLMPFVREMIGRQRLDRALVEGIAQETFLDDPEVRRVHGEMIDVVDELIVRDQALGAVRDGIVAMDVLMLCKGACSLTSLGQPAIDRYLELVGATLAGPGRELGLGPAPGLFALR